jgi:hypothetical protein
MVDAPPDNVVLSFPAIVAIDTCAVWNILSSKTLSVAARGRCHFMLAEYVRYECLVKPRKTPNDQLQDRLREELISERYFSAIPLTIEDLRDLAVTVGKVRRFHHGEFAALALARKLGNGFLTDDLAARRVGESTIGLMRVRTTPHLVGWLVYQGHLTDGDIPTIIADNEALNTRYGQLGKHIRKCYEHAMGLKLRVGITAA